MSKSVKNNSIYNLITSILKCLVNRYIIDLKQLSHRRILLNTSMQWKYYPVNDDKNTILANKYHILEEKDKDRMFGGR